MRFSDSFVDQLAHSLLDRLPCRDAQRRFCPELSYGRHFGPPAADVRYAAVLALIYPHVDQWVLMLTRRLDSLRHHAGQVSLPGGLMETGESIEQTALRECHEELGVPPDQVRTLGRLSQIHIYNSNFLVTPVVASLRRVPRLTPNPDEVDEVIHIPLSALVDSDNLHWQSRFSFGIEFLAPHIRLEDHLIWGATAIMLGELIAILRGLGIE